MSDEVRSIFEASDRMNIFGDANTGVAAASPIAVSLFVELKTVKQGLEGAGASRSSFNSAGASGTQSKAAVYNSIYRRLRRISRTAAFIKKREPDFDNKYKLPHDRMAYQDGLERAKAIHADSVADAAKFTDYGITAAYFTALNTDITAFEGAGNTQVDAKMSSVGETANLDSLVEQFMEIHGPLNQIMKNLLADDPERLAEWRTAAHIERKKGGTSKPPENNPPENVPIP